MSRNVTMSGMPTYVTMVCVCKFTLYSVSTNATLKSIQMLLSRQFLQMLRSAWCFEKVEYIKCVTRSDKSKADRQYRSFIMYTIIAEQRFTVPRKFKVDLVISTISPSFDMV